MAWGDAEGDRDSFVILSLTRQAMFLPVVLSKDLKGYDIYHGHIYTSGIAANILARKYIIENHSWDKIAECLEGEYLRI